MKKNGQLLSLDFLLAIGLVILALGIVLKFSGMSAFEWQEQQEQTELENAGKTAVLLLLSNPQLTCEIKNVDGSLLGMHLNNCIDWSKPFSQASLGLPNDWNYSIRNQTDYHFPLIRSTQRVDVNGSPVDSPSALFAVDFNAMVSNGPVFKSTVYNCLKTKDWTGQPLPCGFQKNMIGIKVWK